MCSFYHVSLEVSHLALFPFLLRHVTSDTLASNNQINQPDCYSDSQIVVLTFLPESLLKCRFQDPNPRNSDCSMRPRSMHSCQTPLSIDSQSIVPTSSTNITWGLGNTSFPGPYPRLSESETIAVEASPQGESYSCSPLKPGDSDANDPWNMLRITAP